MANHFIGIARGKYGSAPADFVTGAASTATLDVEVRIADLDQNGKALTRIETWEVLANLVDAIEEGKVLGSFPPF